MYEQIASENVRIVLASVSDQLSSSSLVVVGDSSHAVKYVAYVADCCRDRV